MKTLKLPHNLFYVLLLVTVVNCKKSNDEVTPSLVGTWSVTIVTATGCINYSSNVSETFGCPATTAQDCDVITFNSDGTYTEVDTSIDSTSGATDTNNHNGTYSNKGNQLTLIEIVSGTSQASETVTFVLSGNTLTMTGPKDATTGTGCIYTITIVKS